MEDYIHVLLCLYIHFQQEIEIVAEEHEAYQIAYQKSLNQLKVEARTIQTEILNFEQNHQIKNVLQGNKSLTEMVNIQEKDFMTIWKSRKSSITRSARYAIFNNESYEIDKRFDEIINLIQSKLSLDESRPMLTIASDFMNDLETSLLPNVKKDFELLNKKYLYFPIDLPEHQQSFIKEKLQHLRSKLEHVENLICDKRKVLESADVYFQNRTCMENFLKETHQKIMDWSRKLIDSKTEVACDQLKTEIDSFLTREKPVINQKLSNLIEQSYNVFGHMSKDACDRLKKEIDNFKKEHEFILDSITNIIIDVNKKKIDTRYTFNLYVRTNNFWSHH